jgi:hypothetical protein
MTFDHDTSYLERALRDHVNVGYRRPRMVCERDKAAKVKKGE